MKGMHGKLTSLHFLLFGIYLSIISVQGQAQTVPAPALLVVNQRDRSISVIDPVTARQIRIISEGDTIGHG